MCGSRTTVCPCSTTKASLVVECGDMNDDRRGVAVRRSRRLALVFNLSGTELVFIAVLGLIVLGPEKLPGAMRKAGKIYREFRSIT
ncbi:MAG: twin-arginine translocase TatA/TatE family subunit, partial [Actinomycetota bacterium]